MNVMQLAGKFLGEKISRIYEKFKIHTDDRSIHRTSAEIRAEITEEDIPSEIARDAEVGVKIQAHDESGEAHADLRNALENLESGAVKAGSAEYAGKLGTEADSYTKTQLDAKLNRHIKNVVYDAEQARFTFVFEDGREIVVDTPLENTVTDGRYDNETLELVLVLVSGQEIRIPVAGMTKVYTGKDTPTATTTISNTGEISVAVKPGSVDAVHLSSALLAAIDSHLTLTGDTKDNIATFADQATRTNLASGDKHAVLFGKIKRWFTDLKALAFKDKAGKADLDTALQAEIDGKANTVHTHAKSQITDFPAALPANGGNADSVGGISPSFIMQRNGLADINADSILGASQYGFGYNSNGFPISGSFISFGGFVGDDYTTQIIASYKGNQIYFRTYDGDLKKWNTWYEIALKKDVALANLRFDQILDAQDVPLEVNAVTRRVIDCHSKAGQGYRSRAAIGLLNNAGFSYPIISAGLDDNGTQWADWKFRHTDGRIIAPNNKYFAFDDDVLKNTGDQVLNNGRLSIKVSAPEHVFYYINGVDNSKLGYVGFGGFPDGSLHIMNYAVNKFLNLSIDGKLYYDHKELAFKSDIGSSDNYYPTIMNWTSDKGYGPRLNLSGVGMAALSATIPLASVNESGVVNTIAQTFAGKKTFNAGVDVSAGGMNVNGGMAVTNGAISCTHEISAANGFYETSDVRLKKNITPVHLSGERIRLCEFDKSGRHGYGVIAQEVEKLYPAAVKEENGYKVVNYTEVLTIKCAEQDERIEALECENTSLKERLERLEKLLLK